MNCPTDYEGYRDCDQCDEKGTCESAKIKCPICGCTVTRAFIETHQKNDPKCLLAKLRSEISDTLSAYNISGTISAKKAIRIIERAYLSSFNQEKRSDP